MKKIFKLEKTYACLDDSLIPIYIPLTVKICPKDKNDVNEIDGQLLLTIENIIEHGVRYTVRYMSIDELIYNRFKFLRDLYCTIQPELNGFFFDVVDVYIGDKEISDDANYINNINKYFENKQD